MLREARINLQLVHAIADQFTLGEWQRLDCTLLHRPTKNRPRACAWDLLARVRSRGGNYAFLFPEGHFTMEHQILLDGPSKRQIPFCFSTRTHPTSDGQFVAYVGKATNLTQRLQWHFGGAGKSTAAQVQYGLVKAGICADRQIAVDFMLKHATIVYRELSGDEHAANRDLLELSMCAKFAPPFNIKSER